jgi:hypothetical protein
MGSLAIEVKRAEANGDKQVMGFTGGVRSIEGLFIEKGDEFVIDADAKVYEQTIGTGANAGKAQYCFVMVGDKAKKFYPSTLTKRRMVVNEDGSPTGQAATSNGTAVDLYRQNGTIAEGMAALAGKRLRVSDVVTVRIVRFGTESVTNTGIPTIDIINDKGDVIDGEGKVVKKAAKAE